MIRIAYGLDFASMIALARSMDADSLLFLDLLSEVEGIVVHNWNQSNE